MAMVFGCTRPSFISLSHSLGGSPDEGVRGVFSHPCPEGIPYFGIRHLLLWAQGVRGVVFRPRPCAIPFFAYRYRGHLVSRTSQSAGLHGEPFSPAYRLETFSRYSAACATPKWNVECVSLAFVRYSSGVRGVLLHPRPDRQLTVIDCSH